jgi:flagellar protein FliO/FliZ
MIPTDSTTYIPTSTVAPTASGGSFILVWILTLILFVVLLWLLYMFLMKYTKGTKNNPQIRVMKRFYIDRNFYVGLLKLFDEYYLILFSNNSSELLKKLTYEEALEIIGEKQTFFKTFAGILKKGSEENETKTKQ